METPHKENEFEKQLTSSATEEFLQRKLKSEFSSWRQKIKPLYEILGTKPDDYYLGKVIMNGLDSQEQSEVHLAELNNKCQIVYQQLIEQINARKNEASGIWNELQSFWQELHENEELGLTFTNAEAGIVHCLRELKSQYNKRKIEKTRKLQEFICELRKEIESIWNECMITEEEKKEFIEFESCEFSERMLQVHKEELDKWKIYHQKNQEILLKIQKRENMWIKLRELEAKANDPARFVNRGGSLLKDQNMHNYLMKNIPKLETELVSLADQFEAEHGKRMKILGREIPEIIKDDWQTFKGERGGRKTPKKAPTPTKPDLHSMRRSIAPCPVANPGPQIKSLDKRFASKTELNLAPPAKRAKITPMKPIQDRF